MKKIIAIILVLVTCLSLCACSGLYTTPDGKTVSVKNNEVVFTIPESNFTVTKLDSNTYYSKSQMVRRDYMAVVKNDEYAITLAITQAEYAAWEVGDVLSGKLIEKYEAEYMRTFSYFTYNNTEFDANWYKLN
jgi:hypothetical protein